MQRIQYVSAEEVLFIHSAAIQRYGGIHGVRELPLLLAAVERSKQKFDGKDLYPDLFTKAAAFFHSLVFNHAFIDGNKRTAITAVDLFLKKNGRRLQVKRWALFQFAMRAVSQKLDVQSMAEWFEKASVKNS